jgi:uncharacterized protein with HEPN domain
VTFDDYAGNLLSRSAVERQFEILGEALNRASTLAPEIEALLPDLRRIVGMRNRIIHGYDSVDDEIIWDAIQYHLPALSASLPSLSPTNMTVAWVTKAPRIRIISLRRAIFICR